MANFIPRKKTNRKKNIFLKVEKAFA